MSDETTLFKCGDQGYINTTISETPASAIYACGKYEGKSEQQTSGSAQLRVPKVLSVIMVMVLFLFNVTNGDMITSNTQGFDNLDIYEPLNMSQTYGSENNSYFVLPENVQL